MRDMERVGLKAEDVLDRTKWERDIRYGKSGVKGGGRVGQDKVDERYGKSGVKGGGRVGQDKVDERYGKSGVKGGGRVG